MNTVQIMGRLGGDPETKQTPSGKQVTNFSVADSQFVSKGEYEAIWWKCTVWGDKFDGIMQHIKKGSAVVIMGEMSIPKLYQAKDGNAGYTPCVTVSNIQFSPFKDAKKEDSGGAIPYSAPKTQSQSAGGGYQNEPLPF